MYEVLIVFTVQNKSLSEVQVYIRANYTFDLNSADNKRHSTSSFCRQEQIAQGIASYSVNPIQEDETSHKVISNLH